MACDTCLATCEEAKQDLEDLAEEKQTCAEEKQTCADEADMRAGEATCAEEKQTCAEAALEGRRADSTTWHQGWKKSKTCAQITALEAKLEEAVADKTEAEGEVARSRPGEKLTAELEEAVADKTEAQGKRDRSRPQAPRSRPSAELKAAKASGGLPDARAGGVADAGSPTPSRASPARRSPDRRAGGALQRRRGGTGGPARVFMGLNDDTWIQRGDDIDGEAADDSGYSVSLSADGRLAVGAYSTGLRGPARGRGDDIDGEAADDWSGYSVSLSADGTALAVGASGNDGAGSYAGHARVFAWDPVDETWKQRGDDIDGEAAYDESGISVSLSADGTTLAVGAHGTGSYAGHARVRVGLRRRDVGSARRRRRRQAADFSGYSVSLSADGTTLAVRAPYNDGGADAGSTRVYTIAPSSTPAPTTPAPTPAPTPAVWVQRGDDIDGEAAYDYSGVSVAGHARVFAWDSDEETWVQRGDDIDGEAAYDYSGVSVSLSADGTALAVGASGNDGAGSYAGHARVFAWDSDDETWKQRGDDIDGEAAYDYSGVSVSLSADGTALAVRARLQRRRRLQRRHARVFAWDPTTYVDSAAATSTAGACDYSGYSVSLARTAALWRHEAGGVAPAR
ncbi:hypothetical protein JL721_12783 [Aureococcus anophagefferens]|nr:hypothetical protein JL721_12783 [Aureococcus anophagefferens]